MLNVTAEEPGVGAGVLLRAIVSLLEGNQPDEAVPPAKSTNSEIWARGPGRRLRPHCKLTKRLDGVDLCADRSALARECGCPRGLRTLRKLYASASRMGWPTAAFFRGRQSIC